MHRNNRARQMKNSKPENVKLLLWEPSGVNRPAWPITVGVPFPKGALRKPSLVSLWDGDRELQMESRILSEWPDGSVRWLLIDFQTDLMGNQRKHISLRFDGRARRSAKPSVTVEVKEEADMITVLNGDMAVVFKQGGRMPFDALLHQGRSILKESDAFCAVSENGKTFHAANAGVKARVESRNALRVVIRCDGKFTASDCSSCLDLTTRVYIYAGKPFLRIYHTITNLERRDVEIENLTFTLTPAFNGPVVECVTGRILDDTIHKSAGGGAALSVRAIPIPETRYNPEYLRRHVGIPEDRLAELGSFMERRADDSCLVRAGGTEQAIEHMGHTNYLYPIAGAAAVCADGIQVALGCRDFTRQAPKRIAAENGRLALDLYWNFEKAPLRFWRGTAKTHEMYLILRPGGAMDGRDEILDFKRLVLAIEEPVAPTFGDTSWLQLSGVFGPLLNYQPRKYPWLEFMFRRIFEQWFDNPAKTLRGSTILDFGDYWNSGRGGQWQNNEMDFGMAMLLYMLRTGYPKPFISLEPMIHHMMDVDTHHEAQDPIWAGSQRYHQVLHGACSGPGLCHQWLEGPLYYYFYTGYERGREIAMARADHFCRAIEAGQHRVKSLERVQGWPLVALSTMNEYFPNNRYVKACNAIMAWLEQWLAEDGDFVYPYAGVVQGEKGGSTLGRGVIGQALAHYHRMTKDERAWKLLARVMELALPKLFTPEGLCTKTSYLRRNYYAPGESDFILEALGYLWERTRDKEWMRLGILNFKLALIQRDPMKGTNMGVAGGACEPNRHWPPFLYYADKSGLLEDIRIY